MVCRGCVFCSPDLRRHTFRCRRREEVPCRRSLCIAQRFHPKFFFYIKLSVHCVRIPHAIFRATCSSTAGVRKRLVGKLSILARDVGILFRWRQSDVIVCVASDIEDEQVAADHRRGQEQRQPTTDGKPRATSIAQLQQVETIEWDCECGYGDVTVRTRPMSPCERWSNTEDVCNR